MMMKVIVSRKSIINKLDEPLRANYQDNWKPTELH